MATHVLIGISWSKHPPLSLITAVEEAGYGQRGDRFRQKVVEQEFPFHKGRHIFDDLETAQQLGHRYAEQDHRQEYRDDENAHVQVGEEPVLDAIGSD